jgi:hypothetical protein
MLSSVIVRGETNRRWRHPMAPMSLIRPDRARPIDRVIDYFGGQRAWTRTSAVTPFHTHPVSRHDGQEAAATRR